VVKIVGVCDDPTTVEQARLDLEEQLATTVSAACSQDYYLDVTSAHVSKGTMVTALALRTGIDPSAICVLGDGRNDVAMFEVAGRSIAMGQAASSVRREADHVSASNADEGFAIGIERLILGS
jgi:HAD superfamily hydrolase (TIGR01484 family)